MSYLTFGGFRRVALSGAILAGALASMGVLATQAGASPARVDTTKTATFSVSCNLGILGTQTLTGNLTSTFPASVASGGRFKATKAHGELIVPTSLVNEGYGIGYRSFNGSITAVDAKSSDATPSPINAAGKGLPIPTTKIVQNKPIDLLIPATGTISVGPFKAGKKGTDTATLSNSAATVKLYTSSNGTGTPTTIDATCNAPTTKTVLGSIKVT